MKFSVAAAVLLWSGATYAAPPSLEARADPPNNPIDLEHGPEPGESFKCGGNTYASSDIEQAIMYGVNLAADDQTRGKAEYPHPFNNDDSKGVKLSFPSYCPADMKRMEYPLQAGKVYNGGKSNKNTGEERVVYYVPGGTGSTDHPLIYYCGIMTHTGAATGGFLLC